MQFHGLNNFLLKTNTADRPLKHRVVKPRQPDPRGTSLGHHGGKKAELEKLLLSVKLDTDTSDVPLYSESYEPSVCLPSSGYKSDPENVRNRIRTCYSADEMSPDHSPVRKTTRNTYCDENRPSIRRTKSLNQFSVTDRVSEIKKRLQSSKTRLEENNPVGEILNLKIPSENYSLNISKKTEARIEKKLSQYLSNKKLNVVSVKRARSFNIGDNNKLASSKSNLQSSTSETTRSNLDEFNQKCGKESKTNLTERRSRSFSSLQNAWEKREICSDNLAKNNELENDGLKQFCEKRRSRKLSWDRSDSETETEEIHLTKAALQRLERRSRNHIRNSDRFFQQKYSYDTNNNDINSNLSDKTLDSGIFDLAVNNLSQGIQQLSKQYNFEDYHIDDAVSLNSGYSSASDSIAESISTYYESPDDEFESKKKQLNKPIKQFNNSAKTGLPYLAFKLNKLAPTSKNNEKRLLTQEHSKKTPTKNLQMTVTDEELMTKTNNVTLAIRAKLNKNSISNAVENGRSVRKFMPQTLDNTHKTLLEKSNNSDVSKANVACWNKQKVAEEKKNSTKDVTTALKKVKENTENSHTDSGDRIKNFDLSKNKQLYDNQNKSAYPNSTESSHLKNSTEAEQTMNAKSADFTVSSSISNLSSHENNPVVKKIDGVQIKLAKTVIAPSLKSLLGVHKNDNKSNGLEVQLVNHKQIDYKNDDKTTNRDIFRIEQTDKFSVLSNNTLTKNLTSDKSDSDLKSKKNFVTRGDSLEVKINFSATQSTSIDTVSKKVLNSPNKHLAKPPLSPLKSPITLKSVGKEISFGPQIKETCEELLEEIKVETDTAIKQPNKKAEPLQTLNCYSHTLNNKSSSVNRGVQCSLLNDAISTKTLFTEVLVSDSTQKHFISKDIADDIGSDILQDIQFTYPQYLIPPGEEIDCTHFSEEFDSKQIQMENVRLQTVLLEVEKARMSSVKALLHVNNALNKVQNDNAQIESELKVCLHEKELLTESIDNANRNHHKIQINNEIIQDKEEFEKDSQDPADLSHNALSWKKEKVEYAAQVQKYKLEYENAEKDAIRLKSLYKKVKEQLEHSNNAFTITLKNNLEAAKRMEEQLQTCLAEKKQLVIKCNEGSKIAKELEKVKQELEELKNIQEEIEDEKDELEKKCKHLEKQKKQLLLEQEELHEQIGHSQEIIEKLTEAEEELEERLEKAIKDKEYLQECLEDNGQILYQMQHRQKALISDKDALSDILNAEVEEKETLQNTLQVRAEEQKELWDKLQDITKIHSTVTESLQQANKKEKNYQEQIEALTKTNHILHYSLEKEKEERSDLQEIFEVMEMEHKKFKMETVGKVRSMETKIEDLMMENSKLTQMKDELALKCDELQNSVADAEERNAALKEEINSVVQSKSTIDNELTNLRENAKETEKNIFETNQAYHNVEVNLKKEIEKTESLTHTLEETESALEDATKKLHETKTKLNETKADLDDLNKIAKERSQTIRELERNLEVSKEQRDKYLNRVHFYESETKELRKTINDQKDEIGTLKTDVQRISRERDANKRNYDMSVRDFEAHKIRCAENLKKLKEEILELSHKIIEKDRLHLKQKSQYQDQIDNTQHDLQFLKQILEEADLRKQQAMQKLHQEILNDDNFQEKMDFNFLRKSHDKFRDEFQSHVEKLEDILRDSKQSADSITVVQSPMSKIKLEELKQLRNEVYDLTLEVNKVKERLTQYSANISLLKVNIRSRSFNTTPDDFSSTEKNEKIFQFDSELSTLMDLMTKIECRHKGVMSRNVILLQRTLEKEDSISKELVKKLQVVSLEGENKQLKTLLGILKNKYNFDEHELATELKLVTDDSEILLNRVNCDLDDVVSSSSTNKTFLSPNGENIASKRDTPTIRVNQNNSTSSKVSLYNSEDEDPIPPHLPKRSSSLRGRLRK